MLLLANKRDDSNMLNREILHMTVDNEGCFLNHFYGNKALKCILLNKNFTQVELKGKVIF